MNYLFFDIECGKSDKGGVGYICEFGYLLTDENFSTLSKGHFMINPDHQFDWYVVKNILQYPKKDYLKQPLFSHFYQQISDILTAPNQIVIGHTTCEDYAHIHSECRRYKFPLIEFEYFDIREPFQVLNNDDKFERLEDMVPRLGLTVSGKLHDASIDAIATMLVCKELCSRHNLKIMDFLSLKMPHKNA